MSPAPLSFAITVPIGPAPSEWLEWTLRSLQAQKVETRVAICSVNEDTALQERLEPFSDIIAYNRFGPDSGQSEAINEGWQAVEADIYGWLNDDDYLAPGALDKVAKIFADNPEIDVVYGHSHIIENEIITGQHHGPRVLSDHLYRDNLISQPSCFVRKSALIDVGWIREDLHYTMDWDLWVRLYKNDARFHFLPETLSSVRHYAHTKTGTIKPSRLREILSHVRQNNSLHLSLRTCLSFIIAHCATYGPFKHLFRYLENSLRKKSDMKNNALTHDKVITLFHYNLSSVSQIALTFEAEGNRKISLSDTGRSRKYAKKTIKIEVDLPPKEFIKLRIKSSASNEAPPLIKMV